ncbi:hypothetical protein ACJO1W_23875 [Vibrio parahaemolyticus]|uniref:hypothetical protein n=1 Tax=Vibrio parahaemolyticus TaxID=670 RepID=UPI00084B5023|nr:hypothetical protein [Vibrio parahaemolyticus]ODX44551.1 hypothetical protein BBM05_17030 [Vibrio parahaemolyticus]
MRAFKEQELKNKLEKELEADFILKKEVRGQFLVDGTGVVIDYLAKARRHVVKDQGFPDEWFGIEVKGFPTKDLAKKGKELAWQALTYAMSEFEGQRPMFVLTYPAIKNFFDNNKILNERTERHYEKNEAFQLVTFLEKGNVGSLEIRNSGWNMYFGSWQSYCSKNTPLNRKKNYGTKRNVGNCA